jgi:LysM repeat protein
MIMKQLSPWLSGAQGELMSTCYVSLRKRWFVTLLALLLLVSSVAFAVPAQAQGVPGCPILITMYDTLPVRALPSFGAAITVQLVKGDVVCMIGRNNGATWVQLAWPPPTGTLLGWAPASAFTTTVSINVLPVTDSSGTTPPPPPPVTPPANPQTYVVKAGDTMFAIAQRFGVTLTALVQANQVPPPYIIYVGQVLIIPGTSGSTTPPGYIQYVVKKGDYLVSIARQAGQDWRALATINGITYPYIIYPGQIILIPATG